MLMSNDNDAEIEAVGRDPVRVSRRRVRTVMVELAWLWTRYQPGAAQV
jgi:hypothetical protein